ncbi:PBS lyase [Streptomyces albipurpureus]|uniref:PBS lyase n=1 Tax=Streptomyces albipurpureus TaxID=2897419 RepID=A0ABT0UK59_9ACTN|nr:PBS lyase [Streptomyces sp. CWNU-1]MCM2387985.1 PBS lyase [Streptomyces sp. CWNU-1]
MFGGIDEVDWAALEHAYGPADDVPDLLHGLASDDPDEREAALDGMYGAVHHQGDVYDSTLACIPFLLELVSDPAVQDRGGIVELLTSIGGIDLDGDDELDPNDAEFEYAANYAMASSAVTASADAFLTLIDSSDRGVRLTAPLALATLHSEPELVLGLLRERLKIEQDPEVRFACVEAAGRVALRHAWLASEVVEWLIELAGLPEWARDALPPPDDARHALAPPAASDRVPAPPRAYDAGLRLSALAQLARCAPQALPADVVAGVSGMLRELRADPVGSTATDGPLSPPAPRAAPPTRVGQLAERGGSDAGRHAPWTGDLLRTLHSGLGDRVADRTALLADQLCSPDWGQRIDAVRMSCGLLRTWRGEYDELVALIGEQLADQEPRLANAAAIALGELFSLAAPASDALAEFVTADPRRWVQEWATGPRMLGHALTAWARTGDPRAVPVLARLLELPETPQDFGQALDHLGEAGAALTPALRERLAGLQLDHRLFDLAGPVLSSVTALRATETLPEVLRVLRGAPEYRREWVIELVLRALTAFGPAARESIPDLRVLLVRAVGSPAMSGAFEAKAAGALWAVEGDASVVLPTLRAVLTARDSGARRSAASVLGAMGRAAEEAATELGVLLRAPDPWTRVDAALALWRVTDDPERAWPMLRGVWESMPFARVPIAERLAEPIGGAPVAAGALGAQEVLRSELSRIRRHNAIDGGYGSHDIVRDEKLLALCRQALNRERPTT